jgi:membrane protein CcdC involved in cytochrome C biogenesis
VLFFIPLIAVVAIIALRSRAPRRLRPELLWIFPAIFSLLGASYFVFAYRPASLVEGLEILAAAVAGAAFGWWRGKLTRIEVHPETHDVSAQMSPIGVVIVLLVFGGRSALRYVAPPELAGAINGGLLAFALCMLIAARVEMWLRASRLLAEAKSSKAA